MSISQIYFALIGANALLAWYFGWRIWTEETVIQIKDALMFCFAVLLALFVPILDVFGFVFGVIFMISDLLESDRIEAFFEQTNQVTSFTGCNSVW